jgi:hypothetical protein
MRDVPLENPARLASPEAAPTATEMVLHVQSTGRSVAAVTVTATAASITREADLNVEVASAAGCSGTSSPALPIRDSTTTTDTLTLGDCLISPSATSTVEVHVTHTYIGDLIVTLIAPDGTSSILHNRTEGSTDNIDKTYTVDLSGKTATGTWTLTVRDAAAGDTGTLDGWTLSL